MKPLRWLWGVMAAIVAAALGVLSLRALRKPPQTITPEVVDLASKQAGAIAEAKDAEAKARAAVVESAGELAAAQKRGEARGLAGVLIDLGGKRR